MVVSLSGHFTKKGLRLLPLAEYAPTPVWPPELVLTLGAEALLAPEGAVVPFALKSAVGLSAPMAGVLLAAKAGALAAPEKPPGSQGGALSVPKGLMLVAGVVAWKQKLKGLLDQVDET